MSQELCLRVTVFNSKVFNRNCVLQAKKLCEMTDEFDDFDDDFSDEEITEDEIASVMNKLKNVNDIADTISMRSDVDDEDATSIASQHDKKAFKLKNLMQSLEMFSRRAKHDKPKV